ncbi:MAG: hypothetical protein KAS32_05110 [Candidatus Peribacteraceae bacterium]|nr:hypothetical protein [Candidatus Peribacteraceae bacterium]
MKRTCFGCRALDWNGQQKRCELGYRQATKYHRASLRSEPIPNEECPKPRTYDRFFGLLENLERATQQS